MLSSMSSHDQSYPRDEEVRPEPREAASMRSRCGQGASTSRKVTFMATGDAPVLEALLEINATALNRSELDMATTLLVRIAALAAVDAPATSYLMHVGPAVQAGVQVEQVQDVLV